MGPFSLVPTARKEAILKKDEALKHVANLDEDADVIIIPSAYYSYLAGKPGLSSETLVLRLICGEDRKFHPRDVDDFLRCIRAMSAFPEFRARLNEMSDVSPEWAAWVKNWQELEGIAAREVSYGAVQSELSRLIRMMLEEVAADKA
jgi:hypothetical protein